MSAGLLSFIRSTSAVVLLVALVSSSVDGQLSGRRRIATGLAAPAGVVVATVGNDVKIDWQAVPEAAQYEVFRGPDSTSAGLLIGAVSGNVLTFTDAGFNAPAGYRVVAVASDGRRAASVIVAYSPPLRMISAPILAAPIVAAPTTATIQAIRSSSLPTRQLQAPSPPVAPSPAPVRKITGVSATMVRAGGTISITGIGLAEASGAYFGTGAPGSPTNPVVPVGRQTDTNVEILTPARCNQSGAVMLEIPGNPATHVVPDTTMTVHCFAATPSGRVANGNAQGVFNLANTGAITITGTGLRAVTNVVDNLGRKYQPTYAASGSSESLTFSLGPNFTPGANLTFSLENVLTNPVQLGQVTGSVFTLTPPVIDSITPLWAQPGQKVRIIGQLLNAGGTPQVSIGGLPAQLLWTSATAIEARVSTQFRSAGNGRPGQASSADSVIVTNPSGKTVRAGGYQTADGTVQPGFFLVNGPSSITQIDASARWAAIGDTVRITGNNLARLMGICVTRRTGYQQTHTAILYRVDQQMGYQTSNTEMYVVLQDPLADVQGGTIGAFAPTQPVGDLPPSQFACPGATTHLSGGLMWP